MKVAFGQTKIFRRPATGLAHALVFWGFCIILFGSIEMVIDGLAGTDKSLSFLGGFYRFLMGSGDIFAYIVAIAVIMFLVRRIFLHIRRFEGIEMKKISHIDAIVALSLILLLMVSLAGMNIGYAGGKILSGEPMKGAYPVSAWLAGLTGNKSQESMHIHVRGLLVDSHTCNIRFCECAAVFKAFPCLHVCSQRVPVASRTARQADKHG